MKITFYKTEENRWYAYLPDYIMAGGTEEECEMVAGADVMLDILANGDTRINVEIRTTHPVDNEYDYYFWLTESDSFGGTYHTFDMMMWLCPVTLFVFEDYPKELYFKRVK